ncbi:unnamed protein product, partial [Cyprideis torosa]
MTRRTRIKICGLKTPAEAQHAAACGADAIGLMSYEPSPRAIDDTVAAEIAASLPAWVASVAVLVNPDPDWLAGYIAQVQPDYLQFHGDEDGAFCRQWGLPYIKALAVKPGDDPAARAADFADAELILLDAWHHDLR